MRARLRLILGAAALAGVLLLALPTEAAGFAETISRGGMLAFLFAFGFGVATSLTPCVLPMVPITLAVFGGRGVSRPRALLLATIYVAGVSVMYGSLGTTFALLGKLWGSFLGSAWVAIPLAIVFGGLGLSMLGAFEIILPQRLQQRLSEIGGRGLLGAFLMGLVGGLIAAPCTGPPLAAMLTYVSTTRDAGLGFALLATYAAGIGVPFWLLAGFSMAVKPGPWMETVKKAFGVLLLAGAVYYLRPVLPFLRSFGAQPLAFGAALVLLALGVTVAVARRRAPHPRRLGPVPLAETIAVAMMVAGLTGSVNFVLTPRPTQQVGWLTSEPEASSQARSMGRPMVVDFAAEWCLPCKEMETKVFAHPEVARALQAFTLLRVDVTQDDEASMQARSKYAADTLPAVRVVSADGAVVGRADRLITPREMLQLLEKAARR